MHTSHKYVAVAGIALTVFVTAIGSSAGSILRANAYTDFMSRMFNSGTTARGTSSSFGTRTSTTGQRGNTGAGGSSTEGTQGICQAGYVCSDDGYNAKCTSVYDANRILYFSPGKLCNGSMAPDEGCGSGYKCRQMPGYDNEPASKKRIECTYPGQPRITYAYGICSSTKTTTTQSGNTCNVTFDKYSKGCTVDQLQTCIDDVKAHCTGADATGRCKVLCKNQHGDPPPSRRIEDPGPSLPPKTSTCKETLDRQKSCPHGFEACDKDISASCPQMRWIQSPCKQYCSGQSQSQSQSQQTSSNPCATNAN